MRVTNLKNQLFVERSQYIRVENPLHKQFEKACMCFKTRRVRTRNFMVFESVWAGSVQEQGKLVIRNLILINVAWV